MKKESVINSCYSLLRNVTPLHFDCGKICQGKCCRGDNQTGMVIFPGEEKLLDKDINVIAGEDGFNIAVCGGVCNRNYRPLSCRIYPLFPVIKNEKGKEYIQVEFDPRADCPLCSAEYEFTKDFIKAVKRVGKYLLLNEKTADTYRKLSAEIEDINKLRELLLK